MRILFYSKHSVACQNFFSILNSNNITIYDHKICIDDIRIRQSIRNKIKYVPCLLVMENNDMEFIYVKKLYEFVNEIIVSQHESQQEYRPQPIKEVEITSPINEIPINQDIEHDPDLPTLDSVVEPHFTDRFINVPSIKKKIDSESALNQGREREEEERKMRESGTRTTIRDIGLSEQDAHKPIVQKKTGTPINVASIMNNLEERPD